MPRQPQWFQHVPSAIEALERFSAPVLDRAGLEKLLHVSRRDAIRLLHRFGGYQAGRTFLIGREGLLAALRSVATQEAYQFETRRRSRLSDDLEATRRDLRSREVKLPISAAPVSHTSLPCGMRLIGPGKLEVQFTTGPELLGQLYELVQLAGRDLEEFEKVLSWPGGQSGA
jgi:hypothetical protein